MSERTLDSFFKAPPSKKVKSSPPPAATIETTNGPEDARAGPLETRDPPANHQTYPFPISSPSPALSDCLSALFDDIPKARSITNQPELDLLHFQPFLSRHVAKELFEYLRGELFFYRVRYTIKRFGVDTVINTPRFTTVFGLDETAHFSPDNKKIVSSTIPPPPIPVNRYTQAPRPIPPILDHLRLVTEAVTGATFNFCLVNYYASGNDSISYHSDDEAFLGPEPAIASFSLGAGRDFLMKHKPPHQGDAKNDEGNNAGNGTEKSNPIPSLKLPLKSGDMVFMRGPTQANWLHSIPKRKGGEADKGRINITFRKALVPAGTNNYYRYNVGGSGEVYRWHDKGKEMVVWSNRA